MKKPLNYRLQMYRALAETMCTNCWFWCIFCRLDPFFAHFGAFYAETSYLCSLKNSKQGRKLQVDEVYPYLLVTRKPCQLFNRNRYELQFIERKKRHYLRCSE